MARFRILAAAALLAVAAGCAQVSQFVPVFDAQPLVLTDPLSSATRGRLTRTTSEPNACAAWLQQSGIAFTPLADREESADCQVRGAVTLGNDLGGSTLRLSPQRPMMTCPLAAAVAVWRAQSVEPAAREILGAGVTGIDHYGVYACRRRNNQETAAFSAHAQAAAIDIAGFRLSDGRRVSVESDWPKDSPQAAFLRRVRDDACGVFSTTLSPDYNAAHANHLHLEMASGRLCR